MFLKALKLKADELGVCVFITIFAFLVGTIVLACVIHFDESATKVFRLGSVMAMFVAVFVAVGFGGYNLSLLFRLQIGFGMTRKNFYLYDILSSLVMNVIIAAFVGMLYWGEGLILKFAYSAYPENKFVMSENIFLLFLAAVVLCSAFREIVGTFGMKFGQKGINIVWIGGIVLFSGAKRMIKYVEEKNRVIPEICNRITDGIKSMDWLSWGMVGLILIIASLVLSWLFIRNQAVRG